MAIKLPATSLRIPRRHNLLTHLETPSHPQHAPYIPHTFLTSRTLYRSHLCAPAVEGRHIKHANSAAPFSPLGCQAQQTLGSPSLSLYHIPHTCFASFLGCSLASAHTTTPNGRPCMFPQHRSLFSELHLHWKLLSRHKDISLDTKATLPRTPMHAHRQQPCVIPIGATVTTNQ